MVAPFWMAPLVAPLVAARVLVLVPLVDALAPLMVLPVMICLLALLVIDRVVLAAAAAADQV